MLKISFSRSESGPPHGFELGDMDVIGPAGSATSRGKIPDQGMMVYLAMVELLDRVRSVALEGGLGRYEFVGADSSFSLVFERTRKDRDRIAIRHRGVLIGKVSPEELSRAALDAVIGFLAAANELPVEDPARVGIANALARFEQAQQ